MRLGTKQRDLTDDLFHPEDKGDQEILDLFSKSEQTKKNLKIKLNKVDHNIELKFKNKVELDEPPNEPKVVKLNFKKDEGPKEVTVDEDSNKDDLFSEIDEEYTDNVLNVEDDLDVIDDLLLDADDASAGENVKELDLKPNELEDHVNKEEQKEQKKRKAKKSRKHNKNKNKGENKDKGKNKNKLKNVSVDEGEDEVPNHVSELIEQKYKKLKQKKILTTGIILVTVVALLVFGTYNTFLKVEKSPQQVAAEVNYINRTTPFPTEGLEGFVKRHVQELMEQNVKLQREAGQFIIDVDSLHITYVSKKSAYIANVYFTAEVQTNQGRNEHNFFLAVKYDYDSYQYHPASEVQLSPNKVHKNLKVQDNEFLSFEGIPKVPDDQNEKVKTFVQNFLMMVYNEDVDISPYYTGEDELGDPNARFVRLLEFQMYEGYNRNQYNAKVVYIVEFEEGIEYKVTNYLNIQPTSESGQTYIIKSIL